MISSLQTRLLLAVSVLALSAVGAVALSVRQWTRSEFRKFQEHEQLRSSDRTTTSSEEVAHALAGRCCAPDVMNRAAAALGVGEAIVIVDEHGGLIAAAGPGAADLQTIQTRSDDGVLFVEAVRERSGVTDGITLRSAAGLPRASRRPTGDRPTST